MLAAFSHLFHLEVLEVWPDTLEDCPMVYTLTLWQYTCCLHEHYTTFTSEIFQNIVLKSSDFLTILFCNFKKGIYEAVDGDLLDSDSLSKLNPYMVIKLCGSQLYTFLPAITFTEAICILNDSQTWAHHGCFKEQCLQSNNSMFPLASPMSFSM